uniref:Nuclear receptor domain-containing protein n=1 Tax=Rhabditophanes sp. KR3021 TaxID=114890 RepID=A0AC35TN53_9BILA
MSSPSDDKSDHEDKCLVCNIPTKGVHFGVNSCRSCSSFNRRSVLQNAIYKCRKNTGKCVIDTRLKLICRYCRFERCKKAGMTLKLTTIKSEREESKLNEVPSPIINDFPSTVKDSISIVKNKVFYDLNLTIGNINDIFRRGLYGKTHINGINLTCMQITTQALIYFNTATHLSKRSEITIENKLDFRYYIGYWEKQLIATSELLMHLPHFYELEFSEKWQYLKMFWPLFLTLHRIHSSLEVFGYDSDEIFLLIDNKTAHRIEAVELIDADITKEASKKISEMFMPILKFNIKFIYEPLKALKLDLTEMSFLVLQLLCSKKSASNVRKEVNEIHEKVLKISCNELQNYLVFKTKQDNYVYRITEMAKLIAEIKSSSEREKELFVLLRVFNVFDCSIFDSELAPEL